MTVIIILISILIILGSGLIYYSNEYTKLISSKDTIKNIENIPEKTLTEEIDSVLVLYEDINREINTVKKEITLPLIESIVYYIDIEKKSIYNLIVEEIKINEENNITIVGHSKDLFSYYFTLTFNELNKKTNNSRTALEYNTLTKSFKAKTRSKLARQLSNITVNHNQVFNTKEDAEFKLLDIKTEKYNKESDILFDEYQARINNITL